VNIICSLFGIWCSASSPVATAVICEGSEPHLSKIKGSNADEPESIVIWCSDPSAIVLRLHNLGAPESPPTDRKSLYVRLND